MPSLRSCTSLLAVAFWAGGAACERPFGEFEGPGIAADRADRSGVPVLSVTLDRVVRDNGGLLGRSDDGAGWSSEASRFYELIAAPATLEEWKQGFGFPARQPDESLTLYRQRAGVVTYYNKNELGLGRELGCASFADMKAAPPLALPAPQEQGLACYVTNYGAVFGSEVESLAQAIAGRAPRNTVAIAYRPSMEPGYQVQFYTYDAQGKRVDSAQLDSHGPRPHPHICMSCHGGVYDEARHLAKNARFLPLDPNVVVFAAPASGQPSLTRTGLEERVRVVNALSRRTPLTPGQQEMLQELYGGQIDTPATVSRASWLPAGWRQGHDDGESGAINEALFDGVLKPYCATCHLAVQDGLTGRVATADMLRSPADLRRFPLLNIVCGSFAMPNAQPTSFNFWNQRPGGLTIGQRRLDSAADVLLDWLGADRQRCSGLDVVSSCNRGSDPDELCGTASSGTACQLTSGRCLPRAGAALGDLRGYCQLGGKRGCPATLSCVPNPTPAPGLERFDGVCVAP
jgi:hypothetical protein